MDKFKLFCILFMFFNYNKINCLNLTEVLTNLQELEILETKFSTILAEAKDFRHHYLSYFWYEKEFKNLFWNIEENTLFFKDKDGKKININKMLLCKIEHDCHLDYIVFDFLLKYNKSKNMDTFINSLNDIIKERIQLIKI